MYTSMSTEEIFIKHVVNDSRSFNIEIFEKALRIVKNPNKGIMVDLEKRYVFEALTERLKSMKIENVQEDVKIYKFLILLIGTI